MKIESNPLISPAPTLPAAQTKLSPEIEQLLNHLKLDVGARVEATVARVTLISVEQHEALAATKTQGASIAERATWSPLLAQPALKLVELKVAQGSFQTITDLVLRTNQTISIVITDKGARLIVEPAAMLKAGAAPATLSTIADAKAAALAQLRAEPTSATSRVAQAVSGHSPSPATAGTVLNHHLRQQQPHQPRVGQSGQALAAAVAAALPKAEPASVMLSSSTKLLALLQHVPAQTLPPALKSLLPLLVQLEAQSLPLASSKPLPLEVVARAIHNNGVFHERNALLSLARPVEGEAQEQRDNDIKSLLIRTIESMTQLSPTAANPAARTSLTNDAIARLWFGLVRSTQKTEAQSISGGSRENLLQLAQTLAENSLAKIQLNQYRSLPSGADPTAQSPPIHLDIPLRWPDSYGNAHLQIFPPLEHEDEARAQERGKRKRVRWSIYMQLELGDEGELAVELSLADEHVDATFWAEKDSLRRKAAAQIHQLRSDLAGQGLQVNELRCAEGPPPEKKIKLDYALIDVKT